MLGQFRAGASQFVGPCGQQLALELQGRALRIANDADPEHGEELGKVGFGSTLGQREARAAQSVSP